MVTVVEGKKTKESAVPSREAKKVKRMMRKYTLAPNKAILSMSNHFFIASELYKESVISEVACSRTHQIGDGEMTEVFF